MPRLDGDRPAPQRWNPPPKQLASLISNRRRRFPVSNRKHHAGACCSLELFYSILPRCSSSGAVCWALPDKNRLRGRNASDRVTSFLFLILRPVCAALRGRKPIAVCGRRFDATPACDGNASPQSHGLCTSILRYPARLPGSGRLAAVPPLARPTINQNGNRIYLITWPPPLRRVPRFARFPYRGLYSVVR